MTVVAKKAYYQGKLSNVEQVGNPTDLYFGKAELAISKAILTSLIGKARFFLLHWYSNKPVQEFKYWNGKAELASSRKTRPYCKCQIHRLAVVE